jgi:hypothetical protein
MSFPTELENGETVNVEELIGEIGAFHEAGHTVAALRLGIPFESVELHQLNTVVHPVRIALRNQPSKFRDWLILYASGSAANVSQGINWSDAWEWIGRHDLEQIRLLCGREFDNAKRWAEQQAEELIHYHTRDIETVARHLLESGELSAKLVDVRLIDAHRLEGIGIRPRFTGKPYVAALHEYVGVE